MKKNYLLSIILTFLTTYSFASNINVSGGKEQGINELSSYLINCFAQDRYGFIWISTDYGLNKFDGLHFTHYLNDEKDSTSLLSNNVRTLMVDREGVLWVGSNKGLQYYDPDVNHFKTVSFPGNISPHVAKIVQLKNGDIWVTTGGWGAFMVDREKLQAIPHEKITGLTDTFIDFFYEDKQGNLWFAIEKKGLVRVNPANYEACWYRYPDIPHNPINDIVEDKEGRLMICASTSVCIYDETSDTFKTLKTADREPLNITGAILSKSGIIYFSTNGKGLYYFDKEDGLLHPVAYSNASKYYYYYSRVSALMEDRDQNLWLGCLQKGILSIPNKPTRFNILAVSDKENQKESIVNSIIKDSKGNIYVSSDGSGVFKLDSDTGVKEHFNETSDIIKLFEDSQNTIWASSFSRGLGTLDKRTGLFTPVNINSSGFIKTIEEGNDKNLYVSTFGSGFTKYDLINGSYTKYDMNTPAKDNSTLDNDWINTILRDSDGQIWMGHYQGISCFDPQTSTFQRVPYRDILSRQICISLAEDHDGNIWIGTYEGLFQLNKKKEELHRFTTNDGLSSNVICGLAIDQNGDVWCSTFMGINKIEVKNQKIINYYTGDGLINKIYNRWVYFQDKDGTIYFGGNNGITYFQPETISVANEYNYEIRITNLYVDSNIPANRNTFSGNKRIMETGVHDADEFHFCYEDNTFTLEFSTMDFNDPENISFEYRILGLDREWLSTMPGANQITYHNLDPGKYKLEVKASKYGVYSQTKSFKITVDSPWYSSTLAFFFYSAIIIAIGLLAFNLIKKKREEHINELKLQYFINLSHEMRSPLTLLVSPIEKLMQGDFDDNTMRTLRGMYRNTQRLLALVNQLLDIRKIDKGQMRLKFSETEMVGFINEVYGIFEYQAHKRNIQFTFHHEMESLTAWIDRNNFDKVLVNLLSNAFKFTPDNGEISIELTTGMNPDSKGTLQHYFEIVITDSGNGLNEEKTEKIFERFYQGDNPQSYTTVGSGIGLNLTKDLVLLHYGSITAENRKDRKGSCFIVRLPLGKKHLKREELTENTTLPRPKQADQNLPEEKLKSQKCHRKTNYKLLIVDDEPEIRGYLVSELEDCYKTITAENGLRALQLAMEVRPDVIISDVMMPQMDGFTLLRKIKSNSNLSHIPVIMLTSKTEFADRISGLDKGADAYITKPFNLEEMRVTIENLIQNRNILKGKFSGKQTQENKIKTINIQSSDEQLMQRVMDVINENIGNSQLNVELLAEKAGISRVQLHRKMKSITGISTSEFIRNIRMKHAAYLLSEKKVDVASVAYAVGFVNQSHFSTVFRKYYGVSPSEYANNTNGKKEN